MSTWKRITRKPRHGFTIARRGPVRLVRVPTRAVRVTVSGSFITARVPGYAAVYTRKAAR